MGHAIFGPPGIPWRENPAATKAETREVREVREVREGRVSGRCRMLFFFFLFPPV